jgi:hypothetical protein
MSKYKLSVLLFSLAITSAYSQKTEQSKKELNSGTTQSTSQSSSQNNNQSSSSSTPTSSSSSSSSSNNSAFAELFIEIFFYVGFYGTIGDYREEDHLHNKLSKYPYFDGKSGNYEALKDSMVTENKIRLDLENKFLYASSSNFGNHFTAKFRPFQYFYLQTDYHELIEKGKFSNDNLSMFQFNLAYDRLRFDQFNLGWTLGATYVANDVGKAGLSYGFNAEVFPGKNLSILASGKWSTINNLPVNYLEITTKYFKKNYFFSLGYENIKVATPVYNYITFGGGVHF